MSAGGGPTLPLRLLDGFCLYTEGANGAEEVVGLHMLENGEDLHQDCSDIACHMSALWASTLLVCLLDGFCLSKEGAAEAGEAVGLHMLEKR